MSAWELITKAFKYCFDAFLAHPVVTIIDLLLVSYVLFVLMKLFRHTRALSLVKGLIALVVLLEISSLIGLRVTNYLLSTTLQIGIIAVIIIFQPEIRRALDQIGNKILGFDFVPAANKGTKDEILADAVCEAVEIMSSKKIGAIIVLERSTKLDDVVQTGTVVDAKLNPSMLLSIFYPGSAMHDGSVIIRDGRVHAAGCFLPLTVNNDISKELGTRHRAALGLSEQADSFVIVVSEETGTISTAENGNLIRGYRKGELKQAITERFAKETNTPSHRLFGKGGK